MMMKPTNNGFSIQSNRLYLRIGIGATLMECIGLYFFLPMFLEWNGSLEDVAATAFICLWLGVVLFGALVSFYLYSKTIQIHPDGISYSSLFGKKHLDWSAVRDYGLSYDGRTRDGATFSNMYIAYFASKVEKCKDKYTKKLSKEALKVHISAADYAYFSEWILPFCMSRTDVEPFLPQDKPHIF